MPGCPATEWSRALASDLVLSVRDVTPDDYLEVRSPVFEGLQIIVSLNCRLQGGVEGGQHFDIDSPGVYLVLAPGGYHGWDRFIPGHPQRLVRVAIDPDAARRSGIDFEHIAQRAGHRHWDDSVVTLQHALSPALQAIAMQIVLCPIQGALRDIYLAGKALELTAVATDALLDGGPIGTASPLRNSGDTERLWRARELAAAHYQQPLPLEALARAVGINVKKLTTGFREQFGVTVHAYVQELRLQEAWRMLATGDYSVSQVACHVGYAIPHFSTLFRKRFGQSPSNIGAAR